MRAFRQEVKPFPTGLYTVSGWFRAKGVAIRGGKGSPEFARLYCHIHYVGRPYSEVTHAYADLPAGDYDWRRVAVALVPTGEVEIERVWVTVAAQLGSGTLDVDDLRLERSLSGGGTLALEWQQAPQATVLSDLRGCRPAEALSEHLERGRWKVIPYATAGRSGHLLWAAEESQAAPVVLPLGASGWQAVYVGLANPAWLGCEVFVRLTRSMPAPRLLASSGGVLQEVFLTVADLTGQDLEISPQSGGFAKPGGIAYIKRVPLTPAEVGAWQADRANPARRCTTMTLDGFSFLYDRRPTTAAALRAEVEPLRDADVDVLILQMGGADMVNYASDIGEMRGQDVEVFARRGDRFYAEAIAELERQGINPTRELIQAAQEMGVKVHVAVRPAAWSHSEPLSEFFGSRFYDQHPEWRCLERDGTPLSRLSLAIPEVRSHLLAVLREAVGFGADGGAVLFTRGVPLVGYEPAFCERFRQRFGADAKEAEAGDPRLGELRVEILTGFLREVRAMLDELGSGRTPPCRLELSGTVLACEADNLRYGIDVRRWVAEGLLDLVCPTPAGGGSTNTVDLAFFLEACKGSKTRLRPMVTAWDLGGAEVFLNRVYGWYDAGADGVALWDGTGLGSDPALWPLARRLGHLRDPAARPPGASVRVPSLRFHRLGDVIMDGRYPPDWGF